MNAALNVIVSARPYAFGVALGAFIERVRHGRQRRRNDWKGQRRSFVHGNTALSNPDITRGLIDEVADNEEGHVVILPDAKVKP